MSETLHALASRIAEVPEMVGNEVWENIQRLARYAAFYADPSPVTAEALEAMGWAEHHDGAWRSPGEGNWLRVIFYGGKVGIECGNDYLGPLSPASLGDLRHLLRGHGIPNGEPE